MDTPGLSVCFVVAAVSVADDADWAAVGVVDPAVDVLDCCPVVADVTAAAVEFVEFEESSVSLVEGETELTFRLRRTILGFADSVVEGFAVEVVVTLPEVG